MKEPTRFPRCASFRDGGWRWRYCVARGFELHKRPSGPYNDELKPTRACERNKINYVTPQGRFRRDTLQPPALAHYRHAALPAHRRARDRRPVPSVPSQVTRMRSRIRFNKDDRRSSILF